MKTTAIICEMNPLHLGHAYILREIRKTADCVIAVMSGNFVQRAECAVLDKYARAEALIRAGADLVVELPFPFCSAGAESFAAAGTRIAHALGADTLAFGVSEDRGDLYERIAGVLSDPEFSLDFQRESQASPESGMAQIREKCLQKYFTEDISDVLRSPNDILAIEYVKSIRAAGCGLTLHPIRRLNREDDPRFAGATEVREKLFRGEDVSAHMPEASFAILARESGDERLADPARLRDILFTHLRRRGDADAFAEGNGGVLERLKRCADQASGGEEMFSLAATKKYTNARLRRAALFDLLCITEKDVKQMPSYTVLLAASQAGCAHLAAIKKALPIPLITKPSDERGLGEEARRMYGKAKEADRLYTMCQRKVLPADTYLRRTPYIQIKNTERT